MRTARSRLRFLLIRKCAEAVDMRRRLNELSVIREGCEKAGMTFSAFIRSKVLEPDRALQRDSEKKKLFRDHIYEINRIGNNVNQVARVVNSKQFASASELKTLTDYLRKIESLEKELMEKLMKE